METTISQFEAITAQFIQDYLLAFVYPNVSRAASSVVDVAIEVNEIWSSSSSSSSSSEDGSSADNRSGGGESHPHHVHPINIARNLQSSSSNSGDMMRVQFDTWVLHPSNSNNNNNMDAAEDEMIDVNESVLDAFRTTASKSNYISVLHDADAEAFGMLQSVVLVESSSDVVGDGNDFESDGGDVITISSGGKDEDDGETSRHNVLTLVAIGGSAFVVLCLGVFAVKTLRRANANGTTGKRSAAAVDDFHQEGGGVCGTANSKNAKAAANSRSLLYGIPGYGTNKNHNSYHHGQQQVHDDNMSSDREHVIGIGTDDGYGDGGGDHAAAGAGIDVDQYHCLGLAITPSPSATPYDERGMRHNAGNSSTSTSQQIFLPQMTSIPPKTCIRPTPGASLPVTMEHHAGSGGLIDVAQVPQFSIENAMQMQNHDVIVNIGIDDDDGGLESLPSLPAAIPSQSDSAAEIMPILLNDYDSNADDVSKQVYVDHQDTNSCPSDEGDTFTLNTLGGAPSIMTSNVSLSRIYGSAATVDTSAECVNAFQSRILTPSISPGIDGDNREISPNAAGVEVGLVASGSPATSVDSSNEYIEIDVPAGLLGVATDSSRPGPPRVDAVQENSILAGVLLVGDKIVAVDGINTTQMSSGELNDLVSSKRDNPSRIFGVLRQHNLIIC